MSVTVATVVMGLRVATVVVIVEVLAVFVEVTVGKGNTFEQYVSAGSKLARTAAATAGAPPLQNGFAANAIDVSKARKP